MANWDKLNKEFNIAMEQFDKWAESKVDIVETANKLYNRQYVSFSRGMCPFGEVLTFKGIGGELTILESEMQFHLKRAEEKDKKKVPADFKPIIDLHLELHNYNLPFLAENKTKYKLIGTNHD